MLSYWVQQTAVQRSIDDVAGYEEKNSDGWCKTTSPSLLCRSVSLFFFNHYRLPWSIPGSLLKQGRASGSLKIGRPSKPQSSAPAGNPAPFLFWAWKCVFAKKKKNVMRLLSLCSQDCSFTAILLDYRLCYRGPVCVHMFSSLCNHYENSCYSSVLSGFFFRCVSCSDRQ